MTDLQNSTEALKAWMERYRHGSVLPDEYWQQIPLPVEANPRWATCAALAHKLSLPGVIPAPTLSIVGTKMRFSLWYYRSPIDLEHRSAKPGNAHRMLVGRLVNGSGGSAAVVMPSPVDEQRSGLSFDWTGQLFDLTLLASDVASAGRGYKLTWFDEGRVNGGKIGGATISDRTIEASRANAALGRQKKAENRAAEIEGRNIKIRDLINANLPVETICEELGIVVASWPTTLRRHREWCLETAH